MRTCQWTTVEACRWRLRTAGGTGYAGAMQTTFYRLLPRRLRTRITPARLIVAQQFVRFGAVGSLGFIVDTATVYGLRSTLGLYGGGVAGYIVAATCNWALNRVWTFRGRGSDPAHRQWALFMLANLIGFVLNRGTYAVLVTFVPVAATQPVIAIAAGVAAGLFANFQMSRKVVFR
jgi:putative flippase GtrA